MESSSNRTEQLFNTQNTAASIILSLACFVGVPGNALVIWIILFAMKKQRSPTVMLILNLAIADELVLITLPLWIYTFVNGWTIGQPLCKFLSYIIYCNMYISIFLITVMSIERFLAVIYPFASHRWRRNTVVMKVVFIVWVLALLFSIPTLIYQVVDADETGRQYCLYMQFETDKEEILYTVLQTLVAFVIPFTVLSICYFCIGRKVKRMSFQTKNRTGVVIGSVVIVFFICWVPHNVLNMISIAALMTSASNEAISETLNDIYTGGVFITGALAFINSCINPVLYAFAARKIRDGFQISALTKLFDQLTHSHKEESRKECTDNTRKDTSVTMEEMDCLQDT
ncbi:leukotriene B4 receptor 1-like [Hemiscyllium ocellatum]|uniref:leukotriene B4 receptor 1-like n=1 Tax=Hemiscyllium ocellatum TaxID=170820 RepID=UPI0029671057|nr:leukotriene B4 receptor 1-like [Hemiscyllium ocellatum]